MRDRDVNPEGGIRDAGLPARRPGFAGRRAAATFQPDPGPWPGDRPKKKKAGKIAKKGRNERKTGKMAKKEAKWVKSRKKTRKAGKSDESGKKQRKGA